MRFRSITAHAFGPLAGETLELADGMTVVVGDNESAKSSWHAAIYASLCGRRRGKGAPRKDEQRFIDLHKPWDRDDWLVTAQVTLDDNRRVELRHDLAGKVDCHAKDLDLGDDISAEVMNDGAPDGSRWLGLDRSSFAATACVEQAQLLRVLGDADGLQEHLQRAAATAGTDATAAGALDLLKEFHREHVGLDRANSSRPLRRALSGVDRAEAALAAARAQHDEYLSRLEEVEELHDRAHAAQLAVAVHEAAAAVHEAELLVQRQREAEALHDRFGGTKPVNVADEDATAHEVSKALASWRSAPAPAPKAARSTADVEQDIAALPMPPDGDTSLHESVRRAQERLSRAEAQLDQHDRSRPADGVAAGRAVAAGDGELLDLARVLETPLPGVPQELTAPERAAWEAAAGPTQGKRPVQMLLAAAAVMVIGGVIAGVSSPPAGGVIAAVGVVGAAVALLYRRAPRVNPAVTAAQAAATAAVAAARQQAGDAQHRHDRAVVRCAELGLAADFAVLRAIPVARAREHAHAEEIGRRNEQRGELLAEVTAAVGELGGALAARGHSADGTDIPVLRAAVENYRTACQIRAEQASAASRLPDLTAQLEAARAAEQRADADTLARETAAHRLLAAAQLCGVATDDPEQAEAALEEWERHRAGKLTQLADEQGAWARMEALLDGRTLDELRALTRTAQAKAQALLARLPAERVAGVDGGTAGDALQALRDDSADVGRLASAADGELRQFSASVPSVAESEEALAAAETELVRVRELQETLQLSTDFLTAAQDRVHRDIAPRLAATVKAWLPHVTGGRYSDVIVNPTTLQVQVCGPSGRWRYADLLSYGTAEQVYLLLRVALADHLTRGHDTCPLLLDDVTVHADAARTHDILNLLLQLSKERQIVLFTQEKTVAMWAREHLTAEDDAVVELAAPPAA